MRYECPVCFYDDLKKPPSDEHICPCCGTQFGYDDLSFSHSELRERWKNTGARWHSRRSPAPTGWSGTSQLLRKGYGVSFTDLSHTERLPSYGEEKFRVVTDSKAVAA